MANVKISELPSTTAVTGSDVVPIVQSGLTKQVSFSDFLASPTLFASGIASFLSTPSSANLRAALTDETGTGPAVFATSPTIDNPTVTGVVAVPDGTAAAPALTNTGDTNTGVFFPDADTVGVSTGGTERLRVDASGNLGLGVTPSAWGSVFKAMQFGPTGSVYSNSGNTVLGNNTYNDGTNSRYLQSSQQAGTYLIAGGTHIWSVAPSGTAGNPITFTQAMTLDSSGNLGLGVTPSAWTLFKALELGNVGTYISGRPSGNQLNLAVNTYYNSGSKYANTGVAATMYEQGAGAHKWYTAPSGTAGDAISFTQAMTLDASGNLGVGTTSIACRGDFRGASGLGVQFQETSSGNSTRIQLGTSANVGYINADAAIGTIALSFLTAGTERARITSGGDLLVGTTNATESSGAGARIYASGVYSSTSANTTNATSCYNLYSTGAAAFRFYVGHGGTVYATSTTITAISDQRLKENIRDLDAGLSEVMALKPRKFDWKAGKGKDKKDDRGWIAQEFAQVFPDMVDTWLDPAPEGEAPYKAVNADLIPVLVKAIQEQQAIIQSLTARIEALEAQS